jgi:flagellar assembly factor FliW
MLQESISATASLHFAAGLPGFPHLHDFVIAQWGKAESPFLMMTAIDDPDVGFITVSPFVFYPEYDFELDQSTAMRLSLHDPSDAMILCIVTLQDTAAEATVNLMGPIVVNARTYEACQAVLPHSGYDVRSPLSRAA